MLDDSDYMVLCPYNPSHKVQKSRLQTHLMKCGYTNVHPQQNVEPKLMKICRFNSNHHIPAAEIKEHEENCPDIGTLATFMFGKSKGSAIPYKQIELPPTDENWDAEEYTDTYNPELKVLREPVLRAAQGVPKAERKHFRHQERERITRIRQMDAEALAKGANPRPQPVVTIEKHAFSEQALRHPKGPAAKLLGMGRGTGELTYQPAQQQDIPRPGVGRALTTKGMSSGVGNVPDMKPRLANSVGNVSAARPGHANIAQSHVTNVASTSGTASGRNTSPELPSHSASCNIDADGFKLVSKKSQKKVGNGNQGLVVANVSPLNPYGVTIPDSFPKTMVPSQQSPQSTRGRGRLAKTGDWWFGEE